MAKVSEKNLPADSMLYYAWSGHEKTSGEARVFFAEKTGDAYRALAIVDSTLEYYGRALKNTSDTLTRIRLLRKKGEVMLREGNNAMARIYFKRAEDLLKRHPDSKERAMLLLAHAWYYYYTARYDSTLSYLQRSSAKFPEGDTDFLIRVYLTYGWTYHRKGAPPKFLEYVLKSMELTEKSEDSILIAQVYNEFAHYYFTRREYDKARKYFLRALRLYEKYKYLEFYTITLNNLGNLYLQQRDYAKAKRYYEASIRLKKRHNSRLTRYNIPVFINLGLAYGYLGEKDSALKYYRLALQINEGVKDPYSYMIALNNIGGLYLYTREYDKAREALLRAFTIAKKHRSLELLIHITSSLSEVYQGLGKADSALLFFKEFIAVKDSVNGVEVKKMLTRQELEFRQKKQRTLRQTQFQARERIWKIILFSIGIILAITLVFLILLIRKYRLARNQKSFIETQQRILRIKNSEIERQKKKQEEILQKLQIKNKNILHSIHSAKKIQNALLKSSDKMRSRIPEHFIFYLPRDIVSGDFYWIRKEGENVFIAVADCTGHGVPAAFLTILGLTYLDKILDAGVDAPAKILNQLRKFVIGALNIENKSRQKEGMDIALVKFNTRTYSLEYSGAFNPLYVLTSHPRTRELLGKYPTSKETFRGAVHLFEIPADRQPVGIGYTEPLPFKNHVLQLRPGDEIVLFSDGFADQFGGRKGKKFGYKWFKKLLISIYELPVTEQEQVLEKTFYNWLGNYEQLDDVLVLGMKCPE